MREINVSIGSGGLKPITSGGKGWLWLLALVGIVGLIYLGIKSLRRMRQETNSNKLGS